ncbi:MAG: hypothetical protein EYC68_21570 [Chloroflexota bacterium]|nr:MAG: hypothetical protein EYC68_21570 [Chloroflexota bacterium]
MKDWLVEIIDQVALGEFLADTNLSCGQRFGLIAVDNAVEFMLIAYVEIHRQLVGGHKPGGIPKKDWELTKSKFPTLLQAVVALEPNMRPLETDIGRYHNFRNDLYHSGTPVTTSATRVKNYVKVAKNVLNILFAINIDSNEWDSILAGVASSLSGNNQLSGIKRQITYEIVDGLVKFSTSIAPTAIEAVALSCHGFAILTSASPSRPSLVQSLARSGHPLAPDVVNARIHDMKKKGWLQKDDLVLSAKGRKELAKKYLI